MTKVGRPSLYDDRLHPKLAFWLAQAGLTDEQIAEEIGIDGSTLYRWKTSRTAFREALKEGKATPDDEVEAALLRRAKGFKYVEQGKERVALPDTTACIFWLKNRRPAEWRDRREQEITATAKGPLIVMMGDDADEDAAEVEVARDG